MATRLLACISANNATVACLRRGKMSDVRRFSDNEKGWAAFDAYLREQSRATISIMVDSIEEEYRTETLPHASGNDRAQLISRKQRQLFRSTPFAAATLQDRTTGRRREDRYLFAAITRPELLAPWLRVINALQLPIVGIYLLPVVTLSIIDRLKIKQPNLLIVSKNEAGLRQTFCKQGRMRVSRLTQSQDDASASAGFYAEEINSTRMYLDALTVTHVDDVVTVLILDHDGSLAQLPAAISRDRANMQCVRMSPAQLEKDLEISLQGLTDHADALHMFLLATARPQMNLVPATLKTRLQVHVLGKYIYFASAGIAVFGVMWLLVGMLLIVRGNAEEERLAQETRTYQARYRAVTDEFPEAPATSDELRDSVETAKRLQAARQTPQSLLLVLGSALNEMPNVGLNRIEWMHGDPDQVPISSKEVDLGPNLINGVGLFGIVSAEVLAYEGDHQAALRSIRAFTQRLSSDERVAEVEIVRLPLDLDPNAGLNGSTSARQSSQSAPFEVALVLRQRIGIE